MADLESELDACIDAILDAADAGDERACSELFAGGAGGATTPQLAREVMPPRERSATAVRDLGRGWAAYLFVRSTAGLMKMELIRFFRRRGRWLATTSQQWVQLESTAPDIIAGATDQLLESQARQLDPTAGAERRRWPEPPASPPSFDRIRVVAPVKERIMQREVDDVERALGCSFPEGYRDYVTRFGEVRDSFFVRVHRPKHVFDSTTEWRDLLAMYWFWLPSLDGFDAEAAQRSFRIADTVDGDELAFAPSRPGRLYLMPRHHEEIVAIDGDLARALSFLCETDALISPVATRWVEPLADRARVTYVALAPRASDAGARARDALLALDPAAADLAWAANPEVDFSGLVFLPALGAVATISDGEVDVSYDRSAPAEALRRLSSVLAGYERTTGLHM